MKVLEINLEPRLMDCQIIDVDGKRCGKVDDLVFEGDVGSQLKIKSILVGPRVWYSRETGSLAALLSFFIRSNKLIEVPWQYVVEIFPIVKLNVRAQELGLRALDTKLAGILERIPGG